MNKNITPIILIVLAIGVYFTFTQNKLNELKSIELINEGYQQALANSEKLIKVRDSVMKAYNSIPEQDRIRLDKMVPNNIDNVRLIIDTNGVASRHGLFLKNIKTSATNISSEDNTKNSFAQEPNTPKMNAPTPGAAMSNIQDNMYTSSKYDTVTVSFSVTTNYQTFLDFIRDLQASLRIIDISKISLQVDSENNYNYNVEFKTYWLKQ